MPSTQDIRDELLAQYQSLLPTLDLSEGTPERDVFVEAPIAGALRQLYDNDDYNKKLFAIHKNYKDVSDSDIEAYCADYDVYRVTAKYSSGIVTFFTLVKPNSDVVINSGQIVYTNSTPRYSFKVVESLFVAKENLASYYNGITGRWEFNVTVEAVEAGSVYVAGANTVSEFDGAILGIQGCNNSSPISGGDDPETNESMLERVSATFKSRGLHNDLGIKGFVENYSESYIASAGDPLMKRDNGHGGCVDIYVRSVELGSFSEVVTITQSGLSDITSGYGLKYITLSKPPVKSISAVRVNDTPLNIEDYELQQDLSSVVSMSTLAKDKIVFKNGITLKDNDLVYIEYIYNKFLYDVSAEFESQKNVYKGRNYLIRELSAGKLIISATIQPTSGSTIEASSPTWIALLQSYINNLSSGSTVTRSDIIQILNGISTIQNVKLDSIQIVDVDSVGISTDSSVILPKNIYPVLSNAEFLLWENN